MLAPRMLVILSSLPDASEAAQTAQRALAAAARPTGLRFAVPEACREGFGQGDALFYSGEEPLEAVLPLLTDETFFLHLMGAHGFAPQVGCAALRRAAPCLRTSVAFGLRQSPGGGHARACGGR